MNKKYRHKRKKLLVECLGGKCAKCGYNKCVNALDFHHIKQNTKVFNVSCKLEYTIDILVEESKKCVLLCANCHRELHNKIWNIESINIPIFNQTILDIYLKSTPQLENKICLICKKIFVLPKSVIRLTCSKECDSKRKSKQIPSKLDLIECFKENINFTKIAKKYKVTDNTIRDWCTKYNMPRTKKEMKIWLTSVKLPDLHGK